jgi:hypothetical protein
VKTRILSVIVLVALVLAGCATAPNTVPAVGTTEVQKVEPKTVKNIIFLLTDGTGPEAWPLARWVRGAPLAVDEILTGAVRTYGADSIITDSAPGATAYATGHKGTDKGISVGAWNTTIMAVKAEPDLKYVPLATLLEGAKLTGRAVGLVATSNVQHATPAAFSGQVERLVPVALRSGPFAHEGDDHPIGAPGSLGVGQPHGVQRLAAHWHADGQHVEGLARQVAAQLVAVPVIELIVKSITRGGQVSRRMW